jgi:hypothetical protein
MSGFLVPIESLMGLVMAMAYPNKADSICSFA